jgi:hypothetical protein
MVKNMIRVPNLNGVSYFGEFNSKIVMRQVTKDGTTVID